MSQRARKPIHTHAVIAQNAKGASRYLVGVYASQADADAAGQKKANTELPWRGGYPVRVDVFALTPVVSYAKNETVWQR